MDLEKYLDKDILFMTPNAEKLNILDDFISQDKLYNIKFMTKNEFLNNYFFTYDEKTIDYLMSKYSYHFSIATIYLENLYFIDLNKNYHHPKLKKLKELKQELIANNLLEENKYFKEYLKNKTIIIKNYPELELYLKNILEQYNPIYLENKTRDINFKVKHFNTLEDEIVSTAIEIIKLIKKGIPLNKIFLSNIDDEYIFSLKRIFAYFNIPLNIKEKNSIYGTKIVEDFLNTGKINLKLNSSVNKKLVDVVNSLVAIKDSKNYKTILKEKLKKTYIENKTYLDAVNIVDIEKRSIKDDEYVFVLGFNDKIFPKFYKDEDFITDNIKDEVELYKTKEKNKIKKESIMRILTNIKNLTISYKDRSNFNEYYKASLIDEENIEVEDVLIDCFNYSDLYNKLKLSEDLDLYRKYKTISKRFNLLYNHYPNIPYNTYSNEFTKIKKELLLDYIKKPLTFSYTSMNSYNLCAFKYYIKYILKLDPFQESFMTLIGSLYHYLLSIMNDEYFNFEKAWDDYLKEKELSIKEKFFLKELKSHFKTLMENILKQEEYIGFKKAYYEKELSIPIEKDILINFTGTIDKLLVKENIDDTYFSIIDYKTGNIDTTLNNMAYGINMQLPVYLYLVSEAKLFESPIFTGMYFQKILQDKTTYSPKYNMETVENNKLKLMGYSTANEDILKSFDKTYCDSKLIKSMKVGSNGFSRYAKVLTEDEVFNILKYTSKVIDNSLDKIIDGDFSINPKVVDNKNLACAYCTYKDLCFMSEKDEVNLEKKTDLSFLEVNSND